MEFIEFWVAGKARLSVLVLDFYALSVRKFQISEHQIPNKYQISNFKLRISSFGICKLEFICDLEFGAWNFGLRAQPALDYFIVAGQEI